MRQHRYISIHFTEDTINVDLMDGHTITVSLVWYPLELLRWQLVVITSRAMLNAQSLIPTEYPHIALSQDNIPLIAGTTMKVNAQNYFFRSSRMNDYSVSHANNMLDV
ncbi:MAG: hypothetical protein ACHWZW_14940 [Spirulina sp.]